MHSPDDLEKWRKAARIAAEVLAFGRSLIKNEASVRDVSDRIDEEIVRRGGLPAWPCQISLDNTAAHQCVGPDDRTVFENNVVKLDVGVRIDGFIGDNATTVDLSGKYGALVHASQDALAAAEKVLAIGTPMHEIGRVIDETIRRAGFVPVRNLSGHTISPFVIHDAPTVPNVPNGDMTRLVAGKIIAIEPFATTGVGLVYEGTQNNTLFALVGKRPVRSEYAREVLAFIEKEYGVFPFTTRWIVKTFGAGKANLALRELVRLGCLRTHPPLLEKTHGIVTQFEHTFLIGETVECLTRIPETKV